MGNPGYTIVGEFSANGFENDLLHERGVMSMARNMISMDSAGSQFFIMHRDSPFLDGDYATFGRVTAGMDVVDRLAETPSHPQTGAVDPQIQPVIESITIDSNVSLPEPNKLSN